MGHSHLHSHTGDPDRRRSRRRLTLVFGLTLAFTAIEFIGGLITDSLALVADAIHMASDSASLLLAVVALWLADRPATPKRSFGYKRAEILAALINGVALVAVSIWIVVEAVNRLGDPPEIEAGWMLAVAAAGLVVNTVCAALLHGHGDNLNIRSAFLHILGDLLGSVGAIVAAIVILASGWLYIDPIISIFISLLIVIAAYRVLRESVSVLLESAPKGIDASQVGRTMASVADVVEVHDLHIWTITSGFPALSAHVIVRKGVDCHQRRQELAEIISQEFGISHITLQVEHRDSSAGLINLKPPK